MMVERHIDFRDAQESEDSSQFVDYLDSVSSLESIQAYKSRTIELLNISEGSKVLEIGCGTGDDAQTIARTVGPSGRVVGLDYSEAMIREAQKRNASQSLPLEFCVGDAHNLEFDDNAFDACRTDRTLQHVESPEQVLSEMARVTRPGGVIIASEPDWGTLAIDHPDRAFTRKVVNYICDEDVRNAWMGRQLFGLFHSVGINDIGVEAVTIVLTDYESASEIFVFKAAVQEMAEDSLISKSESDDWLGHLTAAGQEGHFVSTMSGFIAHGRKP